MVKHTQTFVGDTKGLNNSKLMLNCDDFKETQTYLKEHKTVSMGQCLPCYVYIQSFAVSGSQKRKACTIFQFCLTIPLRSVPKTLRPTK